MLSSKVTDTFMNLLVGSRTFGPQSINYHFPWVAASAPSAWRFMPENRERQRGKKALSDFRLSFFSFSFPLPPLRPNPTSSALLLPPITALIYENIQTWHWAYDKHQVCIWGSRGNQLQFRMWPLPLPRSIILQRTCMWGATVSVQGGLHTHTHTHTYKQKLW